MEVAEGERNRLACQCHTYKASPIFSSPNRKDWHVCIRGGGDLRKLIQETGRGVGVFAVVWGGGGGRPGEVQLIQEAEQGLAAGVLEAGILLDNPDGIQRRLGLQLLVHKLLPHGTHQRRLQCHPHPSVN